jgi:hypothetical protein
VEQAGGVCRKAKQRLQRNSGRASPDPGGHRPKGTARPAIIPLVAVEIPVCESSLVRMTSWVSIVLRTVFSQTGAHFVGYLDCNSKLCGAQPQC